MAQPRPAFGHSPTSIGFIQKHGYITCIPIDGTGTYVADVSIEDDAVGFAYTVINPYVMNHSIQFSQVDAATGLAMTYTVTGIDHLGVTQSENVAVATTDVGTTLTCWSYITSIVVAAASGNGDAADHIEVGIVGADAGVPFRIGCPKGIEPVGAVDLELGTNITLANYNATYDSIEVNAIATARVLWVHTGDYQPQI